MTDAEILAALDDRQTLALTAWAEARRVPRDDDSHSPIEELVAVMVVVRNRRARFTRWRAIDASYKAICLAPAQFSCWNPGADSNHLALMALARLLTSAIGITALTSPIPVVEATTGPPTIDPLVRECLYLADGVISGVLQDRTNGATSYWAPAAMIPPGRPPSWAFGCPRWTIGDQIFVNNS